MSSDRYMQPLAIGMLLTALGSPAQTDQLEEFLSLSLEELARMKISISTQTPQPVAKAPAVVTVITQEDMAATGATNLVEALEGVPGINIRASHFANRPLVHFRGANATQTLLMVNGVSMRDLAWGFGIFWKGLPTSMIERIEIIRGPGSALFGADAASGVINVITKTAGKIDKRQVAVRYGSFGSKSASAQYGAQAGELAFGFTADVMDTDGHDPRIGSDAQSLSDAALGSSASLAPADAAYGWQNLDLRMYLAWQHWRLQADYSRHDDLEVGLTGAGVLDPVTEAEDDRFNLALLYENDNKAADWGLNGKLRYQHLSYSSGNGFQERPPGFQNTYPQGVINRMSASEQHWSAELSSAYRGFAGHELLFGAGASLQELYSVRHQVNSGSDAGGAPLPTNSPLVDISGSQSAFAPEKSRRLAYAYAQDVWQLHPDWELTAGARYDNYSDFGDTLNPRLALVWQTSKRLTTKLLYGRAFRAPSFQELFSETSFTLPNPDLNPEQSETLELSLAFAASPNLHMSLSLFNLDQTDLIRAIWVAGLSKRQFQNIGSHKIQGLELEARWQINQAVRLSGNLSLRQQDDDSFQALGVPEQDAYLRLDWKLGQDWSWNLQTSWVGERKRRDADPRSALDDYFLTDATLRYKGLDNWELIASARNLLDADARDYTGASVPGDLPLPERNFYLEARYRF